MGTIGGSIANNDPAADYPGAVLGLNATIITNKRKIAADDFFMGLYETALGDDEILTAVSFPVRVSAAYDKFTNPASRFALVGVFVAQLEDGKRARRGDRRRSCASFVKPLEARLVEEFYADAAKRVQIACERTQPRLARLARVSRASDSGARVASGCCSGLMSTGRAHSARVAPRAGGFDPASLLKATTLDSRVAGS